MSKAMAKSIIHSSVEISLILSSAIWRRQYSCRGVGRGWVVPYTLSLAVLAFSQPLTPENRKESPLAFPLDDAAVAAIRALRVCGPQSPPDRQLNSNGHPTRRGNHWKLESVNHVVLRVAR